jgi:hypothetical protein
MALASFLTTNRLVALSVGLGVVALASRQASLSLDAVRSGSANLQLLTSTASSASIFRMTDRLYAIANDPVVQKNLQWKYLNSLSQTLAASIRSGEIEHLAVVDGSCNVAASSNRQPGANGDHWKPVCTEGFSVTAPKVTWHSKNGTPVIQVAIPFAPSLAIVAQTPLSENWLRQHHRLLVHVKQIAPESTLVIQKDKEAPVWTPLPWKIRAGAIISQSLIRKLEEISGFSLILGLLLLGAVYLRLLMRSREEGLTRDRNQRTIGQLLANAASDDESKLSFATGYSPVNSSDESDLTGDMIALDRLHRNRFAMIRLDIKEKDVWIEDLEAQIAEMRAELSSLQLEALSHAQQRALHEGVVRKLVHACQTVAAAHDDLVNYASEPILTLSNLSAAWKQGSQSMGIKRFTRMLQESTDQFSRRSELEAAVLAMTSIHERSFATVFELPSRLKQSLQDIRPAISMLGVDRSRAAYGTETSVSLADTLDETSAMIALSRPGQRIHVRLLQPELRALKMKEMVAKAFSKWFFYRALDVTDGISAASIIYLNLRGKQSSPDQIELYLAVVTGKAAQQPAPSSPVADASMSIMDPVAAELADRLAESQGIDWSDKKNTGSMREPVSSFCLMVRIPVFVDSERRKGTTAVSRPDDASRMVVAQPVEGHVGSFDLTDLVPGQKPAV